VKLLLRGAVPTDGPVRAPKPAARCNAVFKREKVHECRMPELAFATPRPHFKKGFEFAVCCIDDCATPARQLRFRRCKRKRKLRLAGLLSQDDKKPQPSSFRFRLQAAGTVVEVSGVGHSHRYQAPHFKPLLNTRKLTEKKWLEKASEPFSLKTPALHRAGGLGAGMARPLATGSHTSRNNTFTM